MSTVPKDSSSRTDDWSMSQERQFIETILQQRINFFIVMFTVLVGAAASTSSTSKAKAILIVAIILELILLYPILRAQFRLEIILDELLKFDPPHPIKTVDQLASGDDWKNKWEEWYGVEPPRSARRTIGVLLPSFCICVTVAALIAVSFDWFADAQKQAPRRSDCYSRSRDLEITARIDF